MLTGAGSRLHGLPAEKHVNHTGKHEEASVCEVDARVPLDWAAGTQQPQQDLPVARSEELGCFVLSAAVSADLPQQAIYQLPGIRRFDPHTGVCKDRVLPAYQVAAREA